MNYEYRMHDPRLGRFFAVDPLTKKYPHNSPYAFSENRLIDGLELGGLEVFLINGYRGWYAGQASEQEKKDYWSTDWGFVDELKEYFNETEVHYRDGHMHDDLGAPFSLVFERVQKGYSETYAMLKAGHLKLNNDRPIIIVSHTQGNAYGIGMVQAILQFQAEANKWNKDHGSKYVSDVKINFIALAVFQADYLVDEIPSMPINGSFKLIQFTYNNDLYQCRTLPVGKRCKLFG